VAPQKLDFHAAPPSALSSASCAWLNKLNAENGEAACRRQTRRTNRDCIRRLLPNSRLSFFVSSYKQCPPLGPERFSLALKTPMMMPIFAALKSYSRARPARASVWRAISNAKACGVARHPANFQS